MMDDSLSVLVVGAMAVIGVVLLFRRRRKARAQQSDLKRRELENRIMQASKLVAEFGAVLENRESRALLLHPESELPHIKANIREAIEFLLLITRDQERRNQLEVANIFPNDYIPDEEYHAIHDQQAGMTKALELLKAGNNDATKLAGLITESATTASQLVLKQIQQRIERESEMAMARHRTLRDAMETLTKQGG